MKPVITVLSWSLLLATAGLPNAYALTFGELAEAGATALTPDEMRAMTMDANVTVVTRQGNTRRWKDTADGKFLASDDKHGALSGSKASTSAPGTWRLGDDGTYCIHIDWRGGAEEWCRALYKAGDKVYLARRGSDPTSAVTEIKFEK